MTLKNAYDYGLGNTPIVRANRYCPIGNLYVKYEMANPLGSIKDRTAFFIIHDLLVSGKLNPKVSLVESSSGNLGLALGFFAREVGVRFVCLIDPTLPKEKVRELEQAGLELRIAPLGDHADFRSARIQLAHDLNDLDDWIWTNQYDNPSNFRAHFETTGPEIWAQTNGIIDYLVCAVGTGGTICGVGHYLKKKKPSLTVVAVEPLGSTIFGGKAAKYLSVGTGMHKPSGLFTRFGNVVDFFCKVDDRDSLTECLLFSKSEGVSVGVTTGSALVVASNIAARHPAKVVVTISPDGGDSYWDLIAGATPERNPECDVTLSCYQPLYEKQISDDSPM